MFDFDPNKDYYKILGVTENSTDDEIKKAFRKLAMQYHPDKGGNQEEFKKINEAYQVIGDKQKRQQYDSVRAGGFGGFGGFGGGGFSSFGGFGGGNNFDVEDIFDVFGSVFGGGTTFKGGKKNGPRKGTDIIINLNVTIEEIYKGGSREIKFDKKVICESCGGSGVESGFHKENCSTCHGHGVVMNQQRTPFGVVQMQTTCPTCHGNGFVNNHPCKKCSGSGISNKQEIMNIEIPIGIEDGQYIKYTGLGNAGTNGGASGDLYIKFIQKPSDKYFRKGNNLYTNIQIDVIDAVLGTEISVDHPEGKQKVKVPKGIQPGDKLSISGKGFGKGGFLSKRGDFIITVNVIIPKKLSKDQEKLWKQLNEIK